MRSALKPAIDNLHNALDHLEDAVVRSAKQAAKVRQEPQLDLSVRDEREVNRKVAARLDQTIHHLEMLLTEEG